MNVIEERIGNVDGKEIMKYTMENKHGIRISILNIGCAITEIIAPDKEGKLENIVVGLNDPYDYLVNSQFFGAIIGRVAGRIKDASFQLDDMTFNLAKNEGENHLHGGKSGFHTKVWDGKIFEKEDAVGVKFEYLSQAGEEGYPGDLLVTVTYTLNEENELLQEIKGETNEKTIVNLTNHSYFNLSGNFKTDIQQHKLEINSDHFLKLAEDSIPTGEIVEVEGTVFDLRHGRTISEVLQSNDPQITLVDNGFDHPFLLKEGEQPQIILSEENSGRKLSIETNEPCVVVYTGNNIDDKTMMAGGERTYKYCALCLETQGAPDAIHHENLPSIVLEPGEAYYSFTKYRFGTDE